MDFVEDIRVGKERPQTGLGAKQDRPSTVLDPRIIGRFYISKDASTQSDELPTLFLLHQVHYLTSAMNTSNALTCN